MWNMPGPREKKIKILQATVDKNPAGARRIKQMT